MFYYYKMEFSLDKMNEYIKNGRAIDASLGGLILGNSHDDGGIYFWVKRGDVYVLEGEVEGYEYILNFGATNYYSKSTERFHKYELHKHDFTNYEPDRRIKILDTRSLKEPNFLLFDSGGFSIINKYSTKGYLQTIDAMNKAKTYKEIKKDLAKVVHNSKEDIEIKFYDQIEGYIVEDESE